jgi:hypothetical protein
MWVRGSILARLKTSPNHCTLDTSVSHIRVRIATSFNKETPYIDFINVCERCPRARFAGCSFQTRICFTGFTVCRRSMTGPWSILSWYANAQRTRFGPASAKGCQPTLPHMGATGMRQARR